MQFACGGQFWEDSPSYDVPGTANRQIVSGASHSSLPFLSSSTRDGSRFVRLSVSVWTVAATLLKLGRSGKHGNRAVSRLAWAECSLPLILLQARLSMRGHARTAGTRCQR